MQHRLAALRLDVSPDEPGVFGAATVAAVLRFQVLRGLESTGEVDVTTWEALVEAGWRLGDRPLYRAASTALLRGDDVADLQRRLNELGFDAGRVDGVFGVHTESALLDFQRNAGLVADSICGPASVGSLRRLGDRGDAASIVDVRERERFRCLPRTLSGRSVVVAHAGGLDALASSITRLVALAGASALVVGHPDGAEQASQANDLDADVFLGVRVGLGPGADIDRRGLQHESGCRIAYFRSPTGWESKAGRFLADLLANEVRAAWPDTTISVSAMSVPLLRATRMPAVLLEIWPPGAAVSHTGTLASSVVPALEAWIARFGDSDAPTTPG